MPQIQTTERHGNLSLLVVLFFLLLAAAVLDTVVLRRDFLTATKSPSVRINGSAISHPNGHHPQRRAANTACSPSCSPSDPRSPSCAARTASAGPASCPPARHRPLSPCCPSQIALFPESAILGHTDSKPVQNGSMLLRRLSCISHFDWLGTITESLAWLSSHIS